MCGLTQNRFAWYVHVVDGVHVNLRVRDVLFQARCGRTVAAALSTVTVRCGSYLNAKAALDQRHHERPRTRKLGLHVRMWLRLP